MYCRIVSAALALCIVGPGIAFANSGNVSISFRKNPNAPLEHATWKSEVWGVPVASRDHVEQAMTRVAQEHFGAHANIRIEMTEPHGINLGFAKGHAVSYPRVWGNVIVDGKPQGEIYADATRGHVQASVGGSTFDRDEALRISHGLPSFEEREAVQQKKDARTAAEWRATHNGSDSNLGPEYNNTQPLTPAVYGMGFSRGLGKATLIDVAGHVPAFTVPKAIAASPAFNVWTNAWGFTRIE